MLCSCSYLCVLSVGGSEHLRDDCFVNLHVHCYWLSCLFSMFKHCYYYQHYYHYYYLIVLCLYAYLCLTCVCIYIYIYIYPLRCFIVFVLHVFPLLNYWYSSYVFCIVRCVLGFSNYLRCASLFIITIIICMFLVRCALTMFYYTLS